jgi:hypothetical protein
MPPLLNSQAYFFVENPTKGPSTKGPSTQGKSLCGRDLKRNQRIQDAHTNIIGTKGVGIHTVTGIGVSTYVICHSDTNLIEKHNINAHPLFSTQTGTYRNDIIVIPGM